VTERPTRGRAPMEPPLPVKRRSRRSAAAATRAALSSMFVAAPGVRPRRSGGPRGTEAVAGSMTGRRRRTDDRPDADRSVLRDPGAGREFPRLTRTVIRGRCRLTGRLGRVSPAVTRARGYRRVVDRLGRVPRAVTRRAIRNDPADQRSQAPTRRVIRGCRPVTCRHDPAAASVRPRRRQRRSLPRRTAEGPAVPPPTGRCHPPVTRPHPQSGWTARPVRQRSVPGNPGPPRWCRRRGVEWLAGQPPPSAASSDAALRR
jgi:hypothetical protein